MRRLSTTVLTVVGNEAEACLAAFTEAANVAVLDPATEADGPLARAQEAWRLTVRSHARYTMVRADPLEGVADRWAAAFEGGGRGELEVAVADVVARWRAESIGLPDYYLVLDPEELPPARKHWYLGVLHQAAPSRVVPVAAEVPSVADAIGRLRAGRWWPELPEVLAGLDRALPDQVMVADEPARSVDDASGRLGAGPTEGEAP